MMGANYLSVLEKVAPASAAGKKGVKARRRSHPFRLLPCRHAIVRSVDVEPVFLIDGIWTVVLHSGCIKVKTIIVQPDKFLHSLKTDDNLTCIEYIIDIHNQYIHFAQVLNLLRVCTRHHLMIIV